MEVALAAGNDLPCTMLLQLLTATNPKQPKDYLFTEQSKRYMYRKITRWGHQRQRCCFSVAQQANQSRTFKAMALSVECRGVDGNRPPLAEEEAALILSVFQELRRRLPDGTGHSGSHGYGSGG